MEILLVTGAVSNLIREGKTFQVPSIMQTSKRIGMITMNDTLMQLVENKKVEPKEAWMRAVDKPSFAPAYPSCPPRTAPTGWNCR